MCENKNGKFKKQIKMWSKYYKGYKEHKTNALISEHCIQNLYCFYASY